jgi:hypothetical protein
MLLVYDDQAKSIERNALLDQRMSPDAGADLAGNEVPLKLSFLGGAERACQELDTKGRLRQQPLDIARVLLSENFGGRHQ